MLRDPLSSQYDIVRFPLYGGEADGPDGIAVPALVHRARPPGPLAGAVEINLDSKQAEGLLLAANFESGNFSGVWDGGTKPWTAGTRSFELSEYGYGCYSDGSAALDLIAPVRSIESLPDSGTLVVRLKLTNRPTVGAQREVAGVYATTQDRALLCQNAYAAGYGMALELRTTDGYSSVLVTEEVASVYQLNTEYVYGLTWLYDGSTGYDMRLVRFGADGLYTNSAFGTLNKIADYGSKVGFFGTDVIAGFVYETRLYEQVISDDLIYSAYDQSSRRELYKSVERFFTGWSEAETSFAIPNINLGVRPPGPPIGWVDINLASPQAAHLAVAANFIDGGKISSVWDGGMKPWTTGTRSFTMSEHGVGCYSDDVSSLNLNAPIRALASLPDQGSIMVRCMIETRPTTGQNPILRFMESADPNNKVEFYQNGFVGGYPMSFGLRTGDGFESSSLNEEAASVYQLNTLYLYTFTWRYDGSTGYDQRMVRHGGGGVYTRSNFGTINKIAGSASALALFASGDVDIAGHIYEMRYYDEVVDDALISAAWHPQTREDLYRSAEKLFTGWSEAEILAAGLLRRGAWRGVSRGIFRGA